MGQIHGSANAGSWSNTAIVDEAGYLYVTGGPEGSIGVTGSIADEGDAIQTKSVYDGMSVMKFKEQMEDVISELKKVNIQLSFMTDEELNHNRRLK